MEELGRWLIGLGGEDVELVGVLLALMVIGAYALHREWLVPGNRWRAKVEDCEEQKATITEMTAEMRAVRDQMVEIRIDYERLKARHQSASRRSRTGGTTT